MYTQTNSLRNIVITLVAAVVLSLGGAQITHAQTTPAAGKAPAEKAIQNPGCSWYKLSIVDCVVGPMARLASSAMLSVGGSFLKFSGAIFDFSINHVIINFRDTLQDKMELMPVINGGWTFFRDIANIIMIGMFVFIAMSLILGLKEYGQKKLIARVLIIAVLMNFSLLFTKIIIDASNFMAYAIYSQTAGAASAGGAPQPFSVADKILAPLHITGTWDTSLLASKVYNEPNGGGVWKALFFGLFGFLILSFLAMIILYGAFLVIARAILFIVLMLSAPLAYVTYLAPHFEASQFGWSNWWKSLINNAAFAPLLMIFLSISILIFQTAGGALGPNDTIGNLGADPQKQVLADGWRVLFVYFLGTGLLFISFRLSSSLAGSISGVRIGQMAAIAPFALGSALGGRLLQRTAGVGLGKIADSKGAQLKEARLMALKSGKAEDWARVEQLRKQKDLLDKGAKSSFNMMNTQLGKALAGSAGLKGKLAGETKGGLADSMHARAIAAEERAKQARVTQQDKDAMRKEAESAELEKHKDDLKTAATNLETAKAGLEQARAENAAASDPALKDAANKQATQNSIDRAPELQDAKREVEVHETRKTQMESGQAQIDIMMQKAQQQQPGQERDRQIRAAAERQAAHNEELQKQAANITAARAQVTRITNEIDEPTTILAKRQQAAAAALAERTKEHGDAMNKLAKLNAVDEKAIQNRAKENIKTMIKTAEDNSKAQLHEVAVDVSNRAGIGIGKYRVLGGGSAGAHMVEHHYEKYTKKESANDLLKDLKKTLEKGGGAAGGNDAH